MQATAFYAALATAAAPPLGLKCLPVGFEHGQAERWKLKQSWNPKHHKICTVAEIIKEPTRFKFPMYLVKRMPLFLLIFQHFGQQSAKGQ